MWNGGTAGKHRAWALGLAVVILWVIGYVHRPPLDTRRRVHRPLDTQRFAPGGAPSRGRDIPDGHWVLVYGVRPPESQTGKRGLDAQQPPNASRKLSFGAKPVVRPPAASVLASKNPELAAASPLLKNP